MPQPSYADLADLADSARLVVVAQPRKLVRVEDVRAPGLKRGHGRFLVKAKTIALLRGEGAIGEALAYLVDLPLDAKGKPPAIRKKDAFVFADPVAGRPGELRLVSPGAQVLRSPQTEATLRAILAELVSGDAPGRVSGVRELIHVPGTLAGEGETQIFLATRDGSAASITVRRSADGSSGWGASFSELVAEIGNPPRRDTIAWYRLACFLPNSLPDSANLSSTAQSRARALADYRMVLGELGSCPRNLR